MEFYLGQIFMGGWNFPPRGSTYCEGQLLPIASNSALFSLFGTTFGGDGRTTFGLPDLRGRAPMHHGNGPGLSSRRLGEKGGAENVTLTTAQMPSHNHTAALKGVEEDADQTDVAGKSLANHAGYHNDAPTTDLHAGSVATGNTGGGQSHTNMQPFLCISFCVALVGVYPSRS